MAHQLANQIPKSSSDISTSKGTLRLYSEEYVLLMDFGCSVYHHINLRYEHTLGGQSSALEA
jgi:hypothetical protein